MGRPPTFRRANTRGDAYSLEVTERAAEDALPRPPTPEGPLPDAPREPERKSEHGAVDERGFRGAPITAALFACNIGVFAAQVILAGDPRYSLGIPSGILRWLGANASLWTIADGRFETLVTSCFLHASILHLALNLLPLWQVGRLVERSIGQARFFPLYLASGVVGSATSAIWGRYFGQTLSVGASGAICGLIGAAIVLGVRTEGWRSELSIRMTLWLAILLLIGLSKYLRDDIVQVDHAAHVGGAIGGAVVAGSWRRGFAYSARAQSAIVTACVSLVLVCGAIVYVRDRTDPFLFLDVDGRTRVAYEAFRAGRCTRAQTAIGRAIRMDPRNGQLVAFAAEIDRECAEARSDGPRTPDMTR
jgi:rhomboid protease GluP